MALLSKQDLRNLFDQLTTEYEYLSNNRLKLESDCKKLQEYIEDQINQIKQINTDFEKLRQEFIQRGSETSKVYNEMPTNYRDIQNDQNSAYMQQNSAFQQQQLIQQQNIGSNVQISSGQISAPNQGMPTIGSQQSQSQYINDQYQQQQMQEQQIQEEDPDQGWELTTLVSPDQIRKPMLISLFAEILDTSVICSTEFSPDGTCLAIGSDKMLRVYNIENDRFLMEKTIINPADENDDSHNYVRSIIWASDGNTIICGSEDSKIRSFDLSKSSDGNSSDIGKLTHCFDAGNGDVFQLQISKDNSFFAAVTSDGSLTIYSLDTSIPNENDSNYLQYQVLAVLTRSNDDPSKTIAATSLSISYDNKLIAVGYTDTSVVIWDVETKTSIAEQKCHSKDIYTLKFLPNGRLVTASLDAAIKIWDVNVTERSITKQVEVIVQSPKESQDENDETQNNENEEKENQNQNQNDNNENENENNEEEKTTENQEEQKTEENEKNENETENKEIEAEKETQNKNENEQNQNQNENETKEVPKQEKEEVETQNQNENEQNQNQNETEEVPKQENEEVETQNQNQNENENENENNNDETQNQNQNENEDQNQNQNENIETEEVTSIVKEAQLELWRNITGHTDFVLSLAVDPSGTWLLSGSKDLTARLTNLDEGVMVYSIKAHKNSIITVCFNPSGKMFCTGSGDKSVNIWSISPEEDIDA